MPTSAARLCNNCGKVVRGKCPTCSGWATSARPDVTHASRKLRAQVLAEQPICARTGCVALATEDDHIVSWAQRGTMTRQQWDARDNHQGLCSTHHAEKTRLEARAAR